MPERLGQLETEQQNPRTAEIDRLSTSELLARINDEDRTVADAVRVAIPSVTLALDAIVNRVKQGGRLFYIGAGTSGRLGVLDASECSPTFGVSPDLVQGIIAGGPPALYRATEASEDDPASGARDLASAGFQSADTLVGIAASGRTPYVLGAVDAARSQGALTVALVCARGSELASRAELAIEVPVGPEVITGSTRMKAGTATKLVLNMLSTGLMIRLGLTYGNLMVNVQPRNEKLRDRARRIVEAAGQVDSKKAEDLLQRTGGSVKDAIVMARLQIEPEAARERLNRAKGVLWEALRG